jgi:hypothetical protein
MQVGWLRAGVTMTTFDQNRHGKLEDLGQIEARLARQEQKTRIILIAVSLLAASAFTIWLGHILEPSWLPFDR